MMTISGSRTPFYFWLFTLLTLWSVVTTAGAADPATLLGVEKAFQLGYRLERDTAVFDWDIADGYHLYRKRIRFTSRTPGIELGAPDFPKGQTKQDAIFGQTEIFRGHIEIRVPLIRKHSDADRVLIEIKSQGCADAGVCYTPQTRTVQLEWPSAPPPTPQSASASASPLGEMLQVLGIGGAQQPLLPPDQAFRFFAEVRDPQTLWVSWQVAPGYYLYREKFEFALTGLSGVELGQPDTPHGEPKQDPEFGAVEVFHEDVGFPLPLIRSATTGGSVELEARFQGCADRGVCYPPMVKKVTLELPQAEAGDLAPLPSAPPSAAPGECTMGPATGFVETQPLSEQCEIVDGLRRYSLALTLLSFLGMGLLLAFTPCIFPMIPILSGIIVGHGHQVTTQRAFLLSLSYVVASALAYTLFGVLAGLFGSNLQALFQDSRIIIAFSGLFVVLALSMFGLINLQMPGFLQIRLTRLSNRQQGGTLLGAGIMGALSALIVGPCVAAPLAGALIYIGQTGDAVLGGAALFAMGMGMGLPLLVIGASAGKLLPRAGTWMNAVKAIFGIGLLGIAVWLLDRILPAPVTLTLWALLLIVPSIYLGALESLPPSASGWRKLWKGVGVAMLVYGTLMLIGVANNGHDPLQPLRGLPGVPGGSSSQAAPAEGLTFRRVDSLQEVNRALQEASSQGRWVMLDFYADWCVSCKEMERYTFSDTGVREALRGVTLLKADVTDNTELHQALMKHFNLIGPPATLFFRPDGEEHMESRVIGYMEAEAFVAHLIKLIP